MSHYRTVKSFGSSSIIKKAFFLEQNINDINNLEPCRASVSDLTSELEERRWAGKRYVIEILMHLRI